MPVNKVFINDDGFIELHVVGNQTADSIETVAQEAARLARQLRRKGRPVLILDLLHQMGEASPEARQLVVTYVKQVDFDRVAMVGPNGVLRLGANLLLTAARRGDIVKYFADSQAAVAWLRRPLGSKKNIGR